MLEANLSSKKHGHNGCPLGRIKKSKTFYQLSTYGVLIILGSQLTWIQKLFVVSVLREEGKLIIQMGW